jgi:outer membrane protein
MNLDLSGLAGLAYNAHRLRTQLLLMEGAEMKKTVIALATALLVAVSTGAALADSIKGTLGLTGKLGMINPADSKIDNPFGPGKLLIETDPGFVFGGGVIYGFDNQAAFEMEITHAKFDFDGPDATLTDLAVGLQFRFTPESKLVPYLGAGFDILMPDIDGGSVDTVLGAHVKGGVDYFIERNIALTGEVKLTGGLDADIDGPGDGKFRTSSLVATCGIRLYFR